MTQLKSLWWEISILPLMQSYAFSSQFSTLVADVAWHRGGHSGLPSSGDCHGPMLIDTVLVGPLLVAWMGQ